MNNEPVAWMLETKRGNISCFVKPSDEFNWIPLYTHPAKTLTDEEINEIAKECKAPWHSHAIDPMMFARAILRKAQE